MVSRPRRRVSPLVLLAVGLAVLVGAGGVQLVRGRARPTSGGSVASREATPIRRPTGQAALPVPRLALPAPSDERVENQGMWAAVDDLSGEERERLTVFATALFKRAAGAVGLTGDELARVDKAWRKSEERWRDLEQWASANPGEDGLGGPILKLRAIAVQELRDLTNEIGESRARAFRKAERDAYRELALRDQMEPSLSTAVRTVVQRKMAFLRWPPATSGSAPVPVHPPEEPLP
jgi:hypothetical protein